MADLVEDELERARQSLAKNAVRVIELEEQRKRMARSKEVSEESEESEEDDDGEMSDSEELAFQMGFNSIEYVTGSVSESCIPFLMSLTKDSAHGLPAARIHCPHHNHPAILLRCTPTFRGWCCECS